MSPELRTFLEKLAARKRGRVPLNKNVRDRVVAFVQPAIDAGYVIERRFGFDEGLQVTDAGREYLGGAS